MLSIPFPINFVQCVSMFVLCLFGECQPSMFYYTLHGTNLKSTESTKYLGVTLTKDLTWGKHVDNIRANAYQQLAFVRRNIMTRSSTTKEKLFLEYAATVWDPHISKQKHSLVMVQRRAARWVTNRHHNISSVSDMLHTLGWRSLEHRRDTSKLCTCYSKSTMVPLACHMILVYPPIQTYSTTLTSNRYAHFRNIPVQD